MLRFSRSLGALLLLLSGILVACWAQATQSAERTIEDDPEYRQAAELFRQGKFVDAMPLFEKLVTNHPSDPKVREGWAWCMFEYAVAIPDPEQRKKVRACARTIALQAKDLGDNSQLLQLMLEQPENGGSDAKFSDRKEIDETMRKAEADFVRGDLDKAREGYLRVLLIDPNNYDSALFTGDVYFKQHVYGSAGEWFSRAIQINPDRETAYRYWGDTLLAAGKPDEARAKFIEAIVAEPYKPRPWQGLEKWLKQEGLELNNVRLHDGSAVTVKDDKNINITLDDSSLKKKKDPNGLAWMTYALGRAGWHTEQSEKEFPTVPRNRHTLQEEAQALELMVTVLKEQKDYKKMLKNLDPSLQSLIKIQEAGFLDPFVLINRADAEIAQDYETYRASNRDRIRRYLDEFMVPRMPAGKQ